MACPTPCPHHREHLEQIALLTAPLSPAPCIPHTQRLTMEQHWGLSTGLLQPPVGSPGLAKAHSEGGQGTTPCKGAHPEHPTHTQIQHCSLSNAQTPQERTGKKLPGIEGKQQYLRVNRMEGRSHRLGAEMRTLLPLVAQSMSAVFPGVLSAFSQQPLKPLMDSDSESCQGCHTSTWVTEQVPVWL